MLAGLAGGGGGIRATGGVGDSGIACVAGAGAVAATGFFEINALVDSGAWGVDSPQPARLQAVTIEAAITRREYIRGYSSCHRGDGYI